MATIRRREFLKAAAGAAAVMATPTILTAKKTDSPVILGEGDHRYEALHNWPQLPDKYSWQTTHDVAFDKAGNLYVIHEGHKDKPDHPAIFVFDADGKFIRAFGQEFQGGGHGLEVHEENGEEFLYVTGYQALKKFAKLNLKGDTIWVRHAPMQSGVYAKDEDTHPTGAWGRDRFHPTNIAFCPTNTGFYVADGYGAYVIHMYDNDANYKSTFGKPGPGKDDGQLDTPHGVWIDKRTGGEPSVIIADRKNDRLQWFTLEGKHKETKDGFLLPANVDTFGELMLVPELQARITLLDGKNNVVARFGDDAEWRANVMKMKARQHPENCPAGKFLHPHDACFDANGNIFIAEWVATGRITKLRKLS
jgi:DNA-binding beta-propeller fold protein YncE